MKGPLFVLAKRTKKKGSAEWNRAEKERAGDSAARPCDNAGDPPPWYPENEFSEAHDSLNKLEDVLIRSDIPRERYEMLIREAEMKIVGRRDIADIIHILGRLASLFDENKGR